MLLKNCQNANFKNSNFNVYLNMNLNEFYEIIQIIFAFQYILNISIPYINPDIWQSDWLEYELLKIWGIL